MSGETVVVEISRADACGGDLDVIPNYVALIAAAEAAGLPIVANFCFNRDALTFHMSRALTAEESTTFADLVAGWTDNEPYPPFAP
jgi:hypothetical protein